MTRNQRRHARVKPKAMSSRVRVGGALHIGLAVENLSLGGAFVRCPTSPPLRSHATVELVVPGVTAPLVLPGKVAHVVSLAEAQKGQAHAGFSIEFVQPLPGSTRQGLERLLRTIDPRALIPVEADEDSSTQMVTVPELEALDQKPPAPSAEVATLRRLVAGQERELARLKAENEKLREMVRLLKAR